MEKKVSGKHSSMNGFAMMKGRVVTVVLASALLLGGGLTAQAQNAALTTCSQSAATAIPQNPNWKANATEWQKLKGEITLYMTNDMGRNGYYDQKPIAELMGEMAGTVDPECVLAVGDDHDGLGRGAAALCEMFRRGLRLYERPGPVFERA